MLPQQFTERMKEMLGEEYPAFLMEYEKEQNGSLRVNTLKGDAHKLCAQLPELTETIAWEKNGFYYPEQLHPGKHPLHEAGAYYIQEASAMAPAFLLDAKEGEKILDLCAAPGGKSTQIAAAMKGKGLLVSNEIHPARARILSENVERMGITNALVCNHDPAQLAEHFPEVFDRIIVDAPCSGEGMFRKNEEAVKQWSPENVSMCAKRQDDILDSAVCMLKPGGTLVYSTCTFAPLEDEGTICRFLERHPEMKLSPFLLSAGMQPGKIADPKNRIQYLEGTARLWPHYLKGEGHFVARLKKDGEHKVDITIDSTRAANSSDKEPIEWKLFREEYLLNSFAPLKESRELITYADQLYLLPKGALSIKGLRVLRPGLHLGTLKKERFEPAHALALALCTENVKYAIDLSFADAIKYIQGNTLPFTGQKGWYLVTTGGYSLGWGKVAGGILKNHYPKGLRKLCTES